jgi:hypothetical protein
VPELFKYFVNTVGNRPRKSSATLEKQKVGHPELLAGDEKQKNIRVEKFAIALQS